MIWKAYLVTQPPQQTSSDETKIAQVAQAHVASIGIVWEIHRAGQPVTGFGVHQECLRDDYAIHASTDLVLVLSPVEFVLAL